MRLACHPYDPPIKRYEAVVDSPYNGFQLCLGTVAEGLKNPAREVPPIVEYLGRKQKIHQIHMRNIRGRLHGLRRCEGPAPPQQAVNKQGNAGQRDGGRAPEPRDRPKHECGGWM